MSQNSLERDDLTAREHAAGAIRQTWHRMRGVFDVAYHEVPPLPARPELTSQIAKVVTAATTAIAGDEPQPDRRNYRFGFGRKMYNWNGWVEVADELYRGAGDVSLCLERSEQYRFGLRGRAETMVYIRIEADSKPLALSADSGAMVSAVLDPVRSTYWMEYKWGTEFDHEINPVAIRYGLKPEGEMTPRQELGALLLAAQDVQRGTIPIH